MYNTIYPELRQDDVLHDVDAQGRPRPWQLHKSQAQLLATVYDIIGNQDKAKRLMACADALYYADVEGVLTLQHANFCRVRLCPICQWRRSLKLYSQTRQIINFLANSAAKQGHKPPAYIMLTVTVPNVDGIDLKNEITLLHKAWQRIMQRSAVRAVVKGWQRATEVTYNRENDTWHPHVHAILAVNPSYFTSRNYIKQATWLALWREATRNPQITQVDIRRVYGDIHHAAAEISKYAAKPKDYLDPSDIDLMEYVVKTLDSALANRRFVAWGGCMADAHRALELDDAENGDLVHIGDMLDTLAAAGHLTTYAWTPGPRLYLKIRPNKHKKAPVWRFFAHYFANKGGPYALHRLAASGTAICLGHPAPHRYRPSSGWYSRSVQRLSRQRRRRERG